MRKVPALSIPASIATLLAVSQAVQAVDLRFDVSTTNNGVLLPNLAFPSANGHVGLLGSSTYQGTLTSKGNVLGIYYNNFNANNPFSAYPNPHDMAEVIQAYANQYWTTPGSNAGWIALNEISSANWQNNPVNVDGYDYHTWCIDIAQMLKNGDSSDPNFTIPAHTGVIMWAPFGAPSSGNRASWQALVQYAYIGDERYIDGATVQADGYSVSTIQNYYQTSYNAWVNNAGVPANRLILSEEYTNSTAGNGYGANGTSGEVWQAAIEARNLAAYNVGFGGYVGYAWGKNAQNSSNAALISYENAYASTMVLQTELPCWTGNDGSSSWNDYLNWTGGLPSTTQFPYDALLNNTTNAGVITHQTAANFFANANTSAAGSTITLDGNQSITTMSFNSPNPYTIARGTGGSLTLTGANSSITVTQGSHFITADLQLASNVTASLTGNLTLSGSFSTGGKTLTKSGAGTLTISGTQTHTAGSGIVVTAGTLNLNSDAGSAASRNLALSATGGNINFGTAQHLASLSLANASATFRVANQYLVTNSLAIDNASSLDLTSNDLLVTYSGNSPVASIRSLLAKGYNDGNWNGGGVESSAAANDSNYMTALGYAEASDLAIDNGGTFDGQTISNEAVIVKYTYYGDCNLDGIVTTDDFFAFVAGFNGQGSGWAYGDFNYDGVTDTSDLFIFVPVFNGNTQNNAMSELILSDGSLSDSQKAAMLSVVPEPASLGVLALGAAAMGMRRRRS